MSNKKTKQQRSLRRKGLVVVWMAVLGYWLVVILIVAGIISIKGSLADLGALIVILNAIIIGVVLTLPSSILLLPAFFLPSLIWLSWLMLPVFFLLQSWLIYRLALSLYSTPSFNKATKLVVCIVEHNNQVLMVKQKYKNEESLVWHFAWRFPGGVVNKWETEEQAVERELLEKVGIECAAVERLGERVESDSGRIVVYWRCACTGDSVRLRVGTDLGEPLWLPPDKISEVITNNIFPPVKVYLKKISKK